ncbi:MAG: hypothetical protein GTO30_10435 [Acidobacteria bacterium]|nr:hypothetical protein [Acidobacteriota bacterium]NIM62050.1 hypothetical protein [Acidobacteriota bacterium]NIQ85854.1 hypothetical protein [Acidobacteriota bacterium]NIT11405.1 hypothetical protein [Acidobacteriota bacterium]
MRRPAKFQSPTAYLLLLTMLVLPVTFTRADDPKPAVPNSMIRGKVFGADGKPLDGAQVLAYHLATEETFSATTDGKGEFVLADLPYGYFDLAIRTAEGLYVADQVANVSPTGKNMVQFRLQLFSASTQADRRAFPGADGGPVGLARVIDQRMVGESFWRSPKGISILSGGGALVLLALTGGGSEPTASPVFP